MTKIRNYEITQNSLLEYAKVIHETAFSANNYLAILKQYGENVSMYLDELNLSYAFYSTVFFALRSQLYIEIAKLFDTSGKYFGLQAFMDYLRQQLPNIPREHEIECINYICKDASTKEFERCCTTQVCLYDTEAILLDLEIRYPKLIADYAKVYQTRSEQIAHNPLDKARNLVAFTGVFQVDIEKLQELIDFAFDASDLVIVGFKDESLARDFVGIDDWQRTLEAVKLYSNRSQ